MMDEFSLLQHFPEQPSGQVNAVFGNPCGLDAATPIDVTGDRVPEGLGLTVEIDGQLYDLGEGDGAVTLADDTGLSVYSDLDGDGAVDHVTTVRFDGTWESWISENLADDEEMLRLAAPVGQWDAYSWEHNSKGNWL